MMINHFLFRKLIRSPFFAFEYQDDARNIKRGSRAQITSTEVFEFIAGLVFELLSRKYLLINKKQWELLKSTLRFKKIANFTNKSLQNYK